MPHPLSPSVAVIQMAGLLCELPELRPFVLSNVRFTGTRIGTGAYGSVEEVETVESTTGRRGRGVHVGWLLDWRSCTEHE